ncbi:hypothetical protein [Ornithinibacillus halotolerans]|uniref:Uncharacterized protein n=1 Tax=Ornithinibacillus halotolerans TaxID=1274357 RepID=A0A916S9V5_9BACI|nr:hypothetical protein [Ornithinibacillus halotolerans]GGA91086.1 hypothetical protein GCM10008025_37000 [Ornithinibacillus halotolerans]
MRFVSWRRIFILTIFFTVISGCQDEIISVDDLGITSIATYKDEETEISYFVVTIQPEKKITLHAAELDGHYNEVAGQAMEYKKDFTIESWESSKKFELPMEVMENEQIRILFMSDNPEVDVSLVEGVYFNVNGEWLKREFKQGDK